MGEDIKQSQNSEENLNKDNKKVSKRHYKLKKQYRKNVAIIIIFIALIYMGGYLYFNDKFLYNTTVNDMNVSLMSKNEAHQYIENNINSHSLTLTFIDNQNEILTKDLCGIEYNQDNHLNDLFDNQNRWLWFTSFFTSNHLELDDAIKVDSQKLQTAINSLSHLSIDQQVDPEDAKIEYIDQSFQIIKEKIGSKINTEKFQDIIINAFSSKRDAVNVYDEGGYVLPKITSEDKDLNLLYEAAKTYADVSITYQTTSGDVVLDGNTLIGWLSQDEEGQYYRDDDEFKKKATEFVSELAKKINNIGTTKTFTLVNNRSVTVSGGNYGLKLNQSKEVEGLLKDIYALKKETRKPETTGVQASYANNGLGDTYVEVDLTKQKMYYVKDGNLVLSSDCVTGKHTDPDRRTPQGTYYVYFKQRNRVLRGTRNPDGTWPYETPVSYWMAFNKGIGLHDASSWRKSFGGNIYINNGSHGCVNLPTSVAGKLYNSLSLKTPVVVHY